MSFDLQLNGLRTVVTGGRMGLGAAAVQTLVEASARVATPARDVSVRTVDGVTCIGADLTTAQGVAHVAQTVRHRWGVSISGLIVCLASPCAASISGFEHRIDGGTISTL